MRLKGPIFPITGIILSILTILYLIWNLNWNEAYILLTNSDPKWMVLAFGFFLLNYVFRTLRFKHLYGNKIINIGDLYGVTFLYGTFNYILPAKTGEIFYIFIAKARLKVNLLHSTSVILAARSFDILAISLFVPVVLIYGRGELSAWVYNILLIFELAVVIAVISVLIWANSGCTRYSDLKNNKWQHIRNELMTAFSGLTSWQNIAHSLLLAMVIWFCIYANFYCIVRGLGFETDLYQLIMISVVLVPLTLMPQGIANLGTHEIAWLAVFNMFGFSHQDSLQIAFGSHVILTMCVALLGIIGICILRKKADRQT